MSNSTIKLKSSTTAGNTPSSLETGEFAINVEDGNLFYGSASAVKQDLVLETLTVKGSLIAENYIVSSSVTFMTQSFSSGSTIFGDSIDDTHLFTGSLSITGSSHIIKGTSTQINQGTKTAIDISSTSGNNIVKLGDALASDNETYIEINDNTQTITTTAQSLDLRGVQVAPNITASGNISSSGYISASAFIGDGSGLTGLPSAAITSYTNASNDRLITTVDSTSVEGQQFLRYTNQGGLIINNAASGPVDTGITVHGNIFGSGSHIRLRSRDATGNSGFYLSSSGDFLATTFKLHFGDIENQGNNTTLIVDDANEQITTSKTLGVTGNITVTGTVDGRDVAADGTKLDGLTAAGISGSFTAASASFSTRVTANDAKLTANTSNVTSAGALMDSEVTNLAQVKAFDSSDYATAAQGAKADTAIQPSQTSSFSTATGVENNADVTDTANVTSAGALMDSEVTSLSLIKGLTAAQISGAFDATSASLASAIPTNNNQLTNGAGYTTNTGTVTSVATGNGLTGGTITSTGTLSVDYNGTGNIITNANANASGYSTADDFIIRYNENDEEVQKTSVANFISGYSLSTATGVENNADVTDTANVTAAGALMDSEVTSLSLIKGLTAAQISGAFDEASASLAADIGGGGAVSAVANGADDRIATFSSTDALNGESALTFDGTKLLINPASATANAVLFEVSVNGDQRAFIDEDGDASFDGQITCNLLQVSSDGNQSAPAIKFGTDINTGIFQPADNQIALQANGGTAEINVSTDGVNINSGDLGVNQTIEHIGDTDTKIDFTTDNIQIDAGGTTGLEVNVTGSTIHNASYIVYDTASVVLGSDGAIGEIVKFGGTTTIAGGLYYLKPDGSWANAQANAGGTATSSLAIAVGGNSTTDGMLLRGFAHPYGIANIPGVGNPLYVNDDFAGRLTGTAPDTTGDIVRIVGHYYGTDLVYFNPSNDWIVVS